MSDVKDAIEYLKICTHPITGEHLYMTVEEIHGVIQAKCGVPALARNLRRHRSYGELLSRRRSLKSYMEYCYNDVAIHNTKEGLSIWQRLKEICGYD